MPALREPLLNEAGIHARMIWMEWEFRTLRTGVTSLLSAFADDILEGQFSVHDVWCNVPPGERLEPVLKSHRGHTKVVHVG